MRGSSGPFAGQYSPATIRWWMESIQGTRWDGSPYGHFDVLCDMLLGRSAEETELLSYCHRRVVVDGARSASGRWCVCLTERAPSAGEARGSLGGDGMSGLIAIIRDLESAADALPIAWSSTQQVFEAQGRDGVYRARLVYYRRNLRVREIDRWLEPRDPDTGRPRSRALTYYLMSRSLGGARTECTWPRKEPVPLRERLLPVVGRTQAA